MIATWLPSWPGGRRKRDSRRDDLACGPREVDPKVHSAEEWCAWARGPDKERLEGRGSGPGDALVALTVELKKLSV